MSALRSDLRSDSASGLNLSLASQLRRKLDVARPERVVRWQRRHGRRRRPAGLRLICPAPRLAHPPSCVPATRDGDDGGDGDGGGDEDESPHAECGGWMQGLVAAASERAHARGKVTHGGATLGLRCEGDGGMQGWGARRDRVRRCGGVVAAGRLSR
jgi:hypothetical protein